MRKPNLTKIGDTLYEVVRIIHSDKFKKELDSESIPLLKMAFDAEHIFKNPTTNEYVFVNKIEELEILN
jgi:hypothetical protein